MPLSMNDKLAAFCGGLHDSGLPNSLIEAEGVNDEL